MQPLLCPEVASKSKVASSLSLSYSYDSALMHETLRRLNRIQRLFRGTVQCEPLSFLVEGEALAFFLSGLGSSRLHPHAHTHTHTQTESTTVAATKRSVLFLLFLIRYYVDITRRWQRSNCGMYRLRLAPLLKEKKLSRTVTSGSVDGQLMTVKDPTIPLHYGSLQ